MSIFVTLYKVIVTVAKQPLLISKVLYNDT